MTITPDTRLERLLYPGAEARHLLGGIGLTKYSELCNNGDLDRVFIGRKTYVTAASVHRFLEQISAASAEGRTAEAASAAASRD